MRKYQQNDQAEDAADIIARLKLQNQRLKNNLSEKQKSQYSSSSSSKGSRSNHQNQRGQDFQFEFDNRSKQSKQSQKSSNSWKDPQNQFKKFKGQNKPYYEKKQYDNSSKGSRNNQQNQRQQDFQFQYDKRSKQSKHTQKSPNTWNDPQNQFKKFKGQQKLYYEKTEYDQRSRNYDNHSNTTLNKSYENQERIRYQKWKKQQDSGQQERFQNWKRQQAKKKQQQRKQKEWEQSNKIYWNFQDGLVQDFLTMFKVPSQQYYQYQQKLFDNNSGGSIAGVNCKGKQAYSKYSNKQNGHYNIILVDRCYLTGNSSYPKVVWIGFQSSEDVRIGICEKQLAQKDNYFCSRQDMQAGGKRYQDYGVHSTRLANQTYCVLMGFIPKTQQMHYIIRQNFDQKTKQDYRRMSFKLPLKNTDKQYSFCLFIANDTKAWQGISTHFDPDWVEDKSIQHEWIYLNWFQNFRGQWSK